jgi:malonate-semialdehyde dehydrogenase (acetylating) / methylmalonate-semialdehyde dehydrogenase
MAISASLPGGRSGAEFMAQLCERAAAIRVGPGRDPASQMGPLVTQEARERVTRLIDSGVAQGCRVAHDGRTTRVKGYERGFFVGPTVLDEVTPQMDVYRQEIFGPVLSVVNVGTVDEAIELINANPYGNGTAIFTSSGSAAREFQRRVRVGMVGINVSVPVPMAYYSFGGWKESFFGEHHVNGEEGIRFYTRSKVVTARWPRGQSTQDGDYAFPASK